MPRGKLIRIIPQDIELLLELHDFVLGVHGDDGVLTAEQLVALQKADEASPGVIHALLGEVFRHDEFFAMELRIRETGGVPFQHGGLARCLGVGGLALLVPDLTLEERPLRAAQIIFGPLDEDAKDVNAGFDLVYQDVFEVDVDDALYASGGVWVFVLF